VEEEGEQLEQRNGLEETILSPEAQKKVGKIFKNMFQDLNTPEFASVFHLPVHDLTTRV
jgi:hypothetical protein